MTKKVEMQALQDCLDEYMTQTGKHEIDEMEANSALARAGLLADEEPSPGRPLREILIRLRDSKAITARFTKYTAQRMKRSFVL